MPAWIELRRAEAGLFRLLTRWAAPGLDLPLAMFRCALGLAVIVSYSQMLIDYDTYFGRLGVCPRMEWHMILPERSLSYFLFIENDAACKAIAFAALAPMVSFWWGIFPRVSALASWYALVSLHDRCQLILDGSDFVLRLMLFLFIFARADRRLSPIAPLTKAAPIDSFPIRLMQVQLCLIYGTTGLLKLYGTKWTSGTALAYTLQLDSFSRGFGFLAASPVFINLATYTTLAFELSFTYLVWPRATRPFILAAGVALHAGIEVFMYVPMFSWVMVATYLIFVPPEWAERGLAVVVAPYARWSRARGYSAAIGGRHGELGAILPRLDVFRAVSWGRDEGNGGLQLTRAGSGRSPVRGAAAWTRLALCVPSLLPWLPVLVLPGGARVFARAMNRAQS